MMEEQIDMRKFALLYEGRIYEIFEPRVFDGITYPVSAQVPAWQFETMIDVTDMVPFPEQNWTWDGVMFHPPQVYVPTPEEVVAQREAYRKQLKDQAAIAMAPVLLSLNLGDATDEETLEAKAWQSYYRQLQELEISGEGDEPVWPTPPAA